jgi:hypothetical protein
MKLGSESDESGEASAVEEIEDDAEKKNEKKKARLRKRGPYRKAHVDW